MPQYMRPQGVPVTVGWSGLAADVADASGVDDATYMASPINPTNAHLVKLQLTSATDPNGAVPTMRMRYVKNASGGDDLTLWVEVRQMPSGTLVAQRRVTTSVGAAVSEWADTMTPTEEARITDYAAIEVWFWGEPTVVSAPGVFTTTVVLDATGYLAWATSTDGTALTAGAFTLPVAGIYSVVISDLVPSWRTVMVSAGTVAHDTAGSVPPFPVSSGGVLVVTINAASPNVVVTVN